MKYAIRDKKEMKGSGVEWIGEIPEGWGVLPLNRSLKRNDGGVWGEDGLEGDEIVLRSTDIRQDGVFAINDPAIRKLSLTEKKKGRLMPGDLLITKSSGSAKHLGKTAIAPDGFEHEEFYYSNFMQRLRLDHADEPRYFYYLINNDLGRQQINYWGLTTSGLVNLNGSLIGRFIFPQPQREEQKHISDFLDEKTAVIDKVVEKKKRQIELLKEKRAALITQAVTKGLDPNVKMKDSGVEWIGEIPEEWSVFPLNRSLERNDGGVWGEDGLEGDEVVLRSTDIRQDGVFAISDPATRKLSPTEKKKGRLMSGDLLITKSSGSAKHLGKTAIAPDSFKHEEFYYSNFMQRLRLNHDDEPRYFYYLMNNDLGRQQINYWGLTTSGLVNLNGSLIGRFIFPQPQKEEQKHIADFLDEKTAVIDDTIKKIRKSVKLIQEYRSSLISHAVTGKIVI